MADPTTTKPHTRQEAPGNTGSRRFRRGDRVLDKAAYGRVFKDATRSRDRYFTVLCRKERPGNPRLGLAIAKKHCKLATGRNRIKRLVRESFRHNKQVLNGLDVVVINTSATHRADNHTLASSLERHWQHCRQKTGGPGDH